jgi:hypothetical protein
VNSGRGLYAARRRWIVHHQRRQLPKNHPDVAE